MLRVDVAAVVKAAEVEVFSVEHAVTYTNSGCSNVQKIGSYGASIGRVVPLHQIDQLFEKFPGARTFPQIRVDGKNIGGYTEFKEFLNGT